MIAFSKFCSCRSNSGITLIEVVASIALLSMLMVGILISFAKHQDQLVSAHELMNASSAIDQLLVEWFATTDPFPINQSGRCGPNGEFIWTARVASTGVTTITIPGRQVRVWIAAIDTPGRTVLTVDLIEAVPQELQP